MKNIKLYKVEWIEGYDNDIEHDVTYEKILSWFEDLSEDASSDYANELRIVRDLPRGCMYDLHHGSVTPAVMRITTTTDIEQAIARLMAGRAREARCTSVGILKIARSGMVGRVRQGLQLNRCAISLL